MRSIKFRAWHKNEKKMRDVCVLFLSKMGTHGAITTSDIQQSTTHHTTMSEIELMQFTGLKDKNGREIYEDDVVATNNEDVYGDLSEEHYRGAVTYDDKEGVYQIKQPHDSYTPLLCNRAIVSIEVIGNVWENPELLGEQQSEYK